MYSNIIMLLWRNNMSRNIFVIGDIHGDYNLLDARFGDIKTSKKSRKKRCFICRW